MKILGISGSASLNSSNYYLLKAIERLVAPNYTMEVVEGLAELPLFSPQKLEKGIPKNLLTLKENINTCDAVIISTPEYTHNIPAALKNMIEWCTHSGEFEDKNVLAISFTPYEPRGKYAMVSLLNSLTAMKANVIAQFPIYKTDVEVSYKKVRLSTEIKMILKEGVDLCA